MSCMQWNRPADCTTTPFTWSPPAHGHMKSRSSGSHSPVALHLSPPPSLYLKNPMITSVPSPCVPGTELFSLCTGFFHLLFESMFRQPSKHKERKIKRNDFLPFSISFIQEHFWTTNWMSAMYSDTHWSHGLVLCVLQPQGSAGWYRPSSMNPQTGGGGLGSTPGGGTQGEGQFWAENGSLQGTKQASASGEKKVCAQSKVSSGENGRWKLSMARFS